jgi:hypothetical protein
VVQNPQIGAFYATSQTIQQGGSTTLKWQTSNSSDVSIDNGIGGVSASGQHDVNPSATTTYTLLAKGSGNPQQESVTITVTPKPTAATPVAPPPTPSAPQPVDESVAIRQAVTTFEAAYNAHDVGRMQAIWTGMKPAQAKAFTGFFKDNPASTVTDSCAPSSLNISGDTATWTCSETNTFKVNGKMTPNNNVVHFAFAKRNGNWTIVGR